MSHDRWVDRERAETELFVVKETRENCSYNFNHF